MYIVIQPGGDRSSNQSSLGSFIIWELDVQHRSFAVLEVKSAEKAEHKFSEEAYISFSSGQNKILGNAVHSAGNKINDKYAAFVGYVADEVLTVHKRSVLHVIKEVYHIVPHEK